MACGDWLGQKNTTPAHTMATSEHPRRIRRQCSRILTLADYWNMRLCSFQIRANVSLSLRV
jgi:hypothetical protein